jgi:chromosome segregation ATPase
MEKIFGRDIGILNQATREGNKAIDELKRKSAVERVNEVNEKTKTLIENTHEELKILKTELENLKVEYEAKNEYIKQINKSCEVSKMLPSYAKVKDKGILNRQSYITIPLEKWEKKFVSANEIESIEKMKQVIESKISKIRESDLYKTGRKLKKEIENLHEEKRVLFNELSSSKKTLSDIEKALERNPDLKEQVKKALKSYKSNRNRGRSR